MALIGAYDDDRRDDSDYRMSTSYQQWLAWLEAQRPTSPEPFAIRERAEPRGWACGSPSC